MEESCTESNVGVTGVLLRRCCRTEIDTFEWSIGVSRIATDISSDSSFWSLDFPGPSEIPMEFELVEIVEEI